MKNYPTNINLEIKDYREKCVKYFIDVCEKVKTKGKISFSSFDYKSKQYIDEYCK